MKYEVLTQEIVLRSYVVEANSQIEAIENTINGNFEERNEGSAEHISVIEAHEVIIGNIISKG